MTAERQDGTATPRRRAGQRRGGLRAAATATPRLVDPPEPVPAPAAQPTAVRHPEKPKTTKYTALLDDPTAIAFDELALIARRKLGRRVDKSQLMRALIQLAADDASLRDQVIDSIARTA